MIRVTDQLQPDPSVLSHNNESAQREPDMHCPRLPARVPGALNFHSASCLRRTVKGGACIHYECQQGHDLRVSRGMPTYSKPAATPAEVDRAKRLEQVREMKNERKRKQRALLTEMAQRMKALRGMGVPA